MRLENYCMQLPDQKRAELRKEFEGLTGLYVPDHADAFDGFCLGRSTQKPVCETCEGTGFVDGPGDGQPSAKVRCLGCVECEDDPCTCKESGYETCPHHGADAMFRHHMNDGMYQDNI